MDQIGIVTKISKNSFSDTYEKLKKVIENNPNLTILLELDHQKNAAKKDLVLNPTRIILFGNPNLGTSLMRSNQSAGLDLPQKILVYENDKGVVNVSYNEPYFLKNRHNLKDVDAVLDKITEALDKITTIAIS